MNEENDDLIGIDTIVTMLELMGEKIYPKNLSNLLGEDLFFNRPLRIHVVRNEKGEILFPKNKVDKIYEFLHKIREQQRQEEKQKIFHVAQIGCTGIIITLIFWVLFWWLRGDTPLTIFLNILLGYIIDAIIYVFAGIFIIAIFKTPVGIRNVIAIFTSIGFSILVLDRLNARFGWGWNFPDIFGVVTGILGLSYFLTDRYLSKKK